MGSPGTRWISRNTMLTTSQMTGSVYRTRWSRLLRGSSQLIGIEGCAKAGVVATRSGARALCGFGFRLCFSDFLDFHPGDSVSIDFFHCVTASLVFESVAKFWNALQA